MKQFSWNDWCILSSSSAVGFRSPPHLILGRSSTRVIASLPSASFSRTKQWREESIEEMEHADKLVERIIFPDGFPNMQVLDPLHIGQNVKEVLDCDL